MKKIAVMLIVCILLLVFVSCAEKEQGNLQNALAPILEYDNSSSLPENLASTSQVQENEDIISEETTENNTQQIDYSPYSALLKAYELDYNIQNTSGTDYEIIGMTLTPTEPDMPDYPMVDASGFCYSNLVDLDGNGILELVIIAYDSQQLAFDDEFYYDDKLYISDLAYTNIVKIYTITPESGLYFIGSLPVQELSMPVSSNYGIEYIVSENKTYITQNNIFQMGNGDIRYYGLTDGYFGEEVYFEMSIDGIYYINGKEYTYEDFEAAKAAHGESEIHVIENLNDIYLKELQSINEATYSFLEDYPIKNFNNYYNAYNNGQFYYLDYTTQSFFPPEVTINNYYKALTLRDYDLLSQIINSEDVENLKLWHSSDTHTYVPGYIINNLQEVSIEDITRPDMAEDIENYINGVNADNVVLLHARVNEVLDPHVTTLGLQIAGGIYDTYYIMSSNDPDGLEWRIEEIIDDKFYW